MRVVFLDDVEGVAQGGDVKEVKSGFARNYLIPKQLAIPASREAMKRIERLKRQAEAQRLRRLADMKELAEELDGTQVFVEMRAGASGRLYGSVTNVIVAEKLSEIIGRDVDRRIVEISEPIREIGLHDVRVHLHSEVDATVNVVVYPLGTDPEAMLSEGDEVEKASEDQSEPDALQDVTEATSESSET